LETREQLNGNNRVFMDEDMLDGLMLRAIGPRWAVQFKCIFTDYFDSRAWLRSNRPIPMVNRERREYFLADETSMIDHSNVQSMRREQYARDYFMTQLPEDASGGGRNYDGDSDNEVQDLRKGSSRNSS